uniref:NACHT, LRR and PYD domains-containing protein 9 n=1 Tax=Jaculus jaculus TaxID=51337 RepID=UPI001E1B3989|nr:NACHT, LRR and PYD domains-containing protein 9 [Jaculus jaculus]
MAESSPRHFTLVDFLNELNDEEYGTFKTLLHQEAAVFKMEPIPWSQINEASRADLAQKLKDHYPGWQAWEVVLSLLLLIHRKDLWIKVRRLVASKPSTYKDHVKEKFRLLWDTETCLQVPEHFYRETISNEYQTLKNIFDQKPGPVTVVVKSVKGAGRTTFLLKVMREWASGNLLESFKFVFFFYVYEMNSLAETSLLELISMDWPECSQMANEIFSQPEKILFIMEGFEELKYDLELRTNLCADWSQRQPTPIILSSLLQRTMLPDSSLLLELGKTSVPRIYFLLQHPRVIYLEEFPEELIRSYVSHFFYDREKAARAYQFVQMNAPLYQACRNPQTCWIVCHNIKWQLERGEGLRVYVETDTSAYACLLKDLFKAKCERYPWKQNRARMKSLCALAAEGKWTQTLVFSSEDLRRNGISESDTLVWLDTKLLKPRGDRFVFHNLRLQSFCAALFYFLLKPTENPNPAIRNIAQLLSAAWAHGQTHLHQVGSFIVGLTREKVIKMLEPLFGSLLHKDVRREMVRCLKCLSQEETMNAQCFQDLFDSLLENSDDRLIAQVGNLFEEMSISIHSVDELTLCSHCLKYTRFLKKLRLHVEEIFSDESQTEAVKKFWKDLCTLFRNNSNLKTLELDHCTFNYHSFTSLCEDLSMSEYHLRSLTCNFMLNFGGGLKLFNATLPTGHLKYLNLYGTDLYLSRIENLCMALQHPSSGVEELMLGKCGISSQSCGILASVLIFKKLKHLSLVDNPLQNEGAILLCEALKHPNCVLETLMLSYCGLTSIVCQYISQALVHNRFLTVLDLGANFLQDNGVAYLCETLKRTDCNLKELWLPGCYFTQMCCKNIYSLIIGNEKLKTLKLGNNEIRDVGVQWIYEALKHPRCRLESLGLDMCQLTTDCCISLALVLTTCQTLKTLNLSWITMDYDGLMMLCEALSNENCALEVLGLDKSAFGKDAQLLLQAVEEKKACLTIQRHPWLEEECRMKGIPLMESTQK